MSPSGPASYCTDTSTGTFCFIGDKDGPTALELFRSKIIDSGTDYLEINSGAPKGVKINGDLNMSGKSINDFSFLKSSRSGINLPIESVTIYPSLMTYSSIKGTDRNAASISASTLTVSEIKDNKLKIANYTANGVILTSLNGYRWLCNPNNDGAFICVRIF
ncbi:hypothetical protein HYW74_03055 [Candidatus Pacearchaeota archaeon]|nr:hypothetical protein [Candidatus Pacearchaeota archaeon]